MCDKCFFFSFLIQGFTGPDSTTEPNSIASDITDSVRPNNKIKNNSTPPLLTNNGTNNNLTNNNNNHQSHRYPNSVVATKPQNPLYGQTTSYPPNHLYDTTLSRRSPEGKDNEAFHIEQDKKIISANNAAAVAAAVNNNNSQKMGNDISTEIFSASNENGKINVQVTVLVGEFLIFSLLVAV